MCSGCSLRDSAAVPPQVFVRYYFMLQITASQQNSQRTALLSIRFCPYPEDSHSQFTSHYDSFSCWSPKEEGNWLTKDDITGIPWKIILPSFLRDDSQTQRPKPPHKPRLCLHLHVDKNSRAPQLRNILAIKALSLTKYASTASLKEKHTECLLDIFSWRDEVSKEEGCDFTPTEVTLIHDSIF